MDMHQLDALNRHERTLWWSRGNSGDRTCVALVLVGDQLESLIS